MLSWQDNNNTPKQNGKDHNDNINTITTGDDRTRLQASAQGKFWDMYDYLFKHSQMVTNDSLRRSAASLGLNLSRYDSEFLDRVYSNHIDEDIQSGNNSGVKNTPTFFINGEFYNGPWDLDSLLGALDEESVFSWRQ